MAFYLSCSKHYIELHPPLKMNTTGPVNHMIRAHPLGKFIYLKIPKEVGGIIILLMRKCVYPSGKPLPWPVACRSLRLSLLF